MSYCALLTRQEHRVIVLCPHAMNWFLWHAEQQVVSCKVLSSVAVTFQVVTDG